ncbi:MAG: phosphoribosylglycinamide formyltransferase [Candidatus Bipolaricaulis sp.]|nr:phosphoribosylglycinamide formyltransferase [Candidatus Bipolaricaulis sp.]
MRRVAVLISGRGTNLERIVAEVRDGCLSGVCAVVVVVSNRPEAGGLEVARRAGIPTRVVPSSGLDGEAYGRRLLEALGPWKLDAVVLAGFMRVLSAEVVERFRNRIVNIHPADTAEYQGMDGYGWAFERGLSETKVTVHLVDEGVDTGRVLAQETVSLQGATTLDDVRRRGLDVEHDLYSRALRRWFENEGRSWDASTGGRAPCAES